jgi:CheY-like chemotaxis protein
MAPHSPATILVIDDEPSVVRALAGLLRRDGYLVGTASNGHHALARLQEQPYDVIVCDLRMPELDGPAFYATLTRQYPALRQRVIFRLCRKVAFSRPNPKIGFQKINGLRD